MAARPKAYRLPTCQSQAELGPAIFATDVGVENDPLQYENGYIWYDVVGITPARERSLDEVKTEIEIRYTNDEIAKRLKAKADAMIEKLKTGGSLKDIAAEDKLKVETATGVKRGDPTENLSALDDQCHLPNAQGRGRLRRGRAGDAARGVPGQDIKVPELDMNSPDAQAHFRESASRARRRIARRLCGAAGA